MINFLNKNNISKYLAIFVFFSFIFIPCNANSQTIDASKLVPRVEISLSPTSGSFTEGAVFDVPIILNTKGQNVNGIETRLVFDKDRLMIIKPSSGASIIGVWVEPPKYDNTAGVASYIGVVPNGIMTSSGLIGTVSFKALKAGKANIRISSNSAVLLNDGLGTKSEIDLGRAEYSIVPKSPEGVSVFSETHPFQGSWYNNNSPIISWDRDSGVEGFSFVLDNKPNTIPESVINSNETSKSFENLSDGLWYFHIKAVKRGAWGTTGHFLVRVDTTPPAKFKPEVNYLVAASVLVERTLVSFFTSDNLSGIDHYEVGVIDKAQAVSESPVFTQAESPFQVPLKAGGNLRVIVRAVDKAGNIRDASIDVKPPLILTKFLKDNIVLVLSLIIFLGLFLLITHYFVGHHILRYIQRVFAIAKRESKILEVPDVEKPKIRKKR